MKKINNYFWYLPYYFFVFFAIFISIKFILIFFFRTAYEPRFMFELTPAHILTGLNNLQLLLLSYILILFDTYLHLNTSKKNLMYSLLPTLIMLCGLGISIATQEIAISNLLQYLVFGCLILILLIDQKHSLMLPDTLTYPKKMAMKTKVTKIKPIIAKAQPKVAQASIERKRSRASVIHISSLFSLFKKAKKTSHESSRRIKTSKTPKTVSSKAEKTERAIDDKVGEKLPMFKEISPELIEMPEDDFKRVQTLLEELKQKSKKLEVLENEIEKRRQTLVEQERTFADRLFSINDRKSHYDFSASLDTGIDSNRELIKEVDEYPESLDNVPESAAILQKGLLKQINGPFAKLLGFEKKELLDKSLFIFIDLGGFADIKNYYLNRLKGGESSSFKTIFWTKDKNRISAEVISRPTTFNGKNAEIIIIKEVNDQKQNVIIKNQ